MAGSGATAAATVVLKLPASAAHVRTARLVAAAMARRSGVDEGLLDEVRLAVGEACARAVRLHERYGVEGPVTVEFGDRDRFSISVIDSAPVRAKPPWTNGASGDDEMAAGKQPAAVAVGSPGSADGVDDRRVDGGPGGPRVGAAGEVDNLVPIRSTDNAVDAGPGLHPAGVDDDARTPADPLIDLPWSGVDSTADALGLALLDAVVQDLAVTEAAGGTGTRVAMSWPLDR
jgi:hypothetical protein